jgi:outer membrane lipoprotein-sorting protein
METLCYRQSLLFVRILVALLLLTGVGPGRANAQELPVAAPLSGPQVVERMVAMNQRRAAALQAYTGVRVYHVEYHGMFGHRTGDMVVKVVYHRPDQKEFTILEESGNAWIRNHVFKKLIEAEQESTTRKTNERSDIDPDNYEFRLVGYERTPDHSSYVLEAKPRRKKKYLFRGKIWVDDQDFAIQRIQGEPAKHLSFWIQKNEFEHTYQKFGDFWLPVRDDATSKMRLFGRATLTIQYKDYQLSDVRSAKSGGSVPTMQQAGSSNKD